jgi:translation initiation factor IF-3
MMNNRGRQNPADIEPEFRINERIRVPEVRLVGENLAEIAEKVGVEMSDAMIVPTRKAQEWAESLELDLVEISPNATPPVCRIIDYRKFLFDRKKRDKELKASQVKQVIKEIRFGPHTDDHDFNFKVKHALSFLEDGNRVKAYVQFKGRAIAFKEHGEILLNRFTEALKESGGLESPPKLEGRKMIVYYVPKKNKKK